VGTGLIHAILELSFKQHPPYHRPISVQGGWQGGAAAPGLKNFRASTSCSKLLNNKKYFKTVKNFRATLFFRASASCSKILNDKKYAFSK